MERSQWRTLALLAIGSIGCRTRTHRIDLDEAIQPVVEPGDSIEAGLEHVACGCLAGCDRIGGVDE
jgi:hypothetical protein